MKVTNHKLVGADNKMVPFVRTPHGGNALSGNRPRFLVIHYTAGASMAGAVKWFTRSEAKASAHLVIGHDGAITQMAPFDKVCWHAGESRWKNVTGLNSHSVGIEIANWGKLTRSGSGGWVSWAGAPVPDGRVMIAAHKNFPGQQHGWETFEEAQFLATVAAAAAICAEYGIGPNEVVGHDDIAPTRKVDPGPAFPMDKFRTLVFGRSADVGDDLLYMVRSDTGLNLRGGAGVEHPKLKNLPDGTVVHVIDNTSTGKWWMVAERVNGKDDNTGFVHSQWLQPA